MTDRGILFSAPMVRALLAGTKTQTRRQLYTLQKLRKGGPRLYYIHRDGVNVPYDPPEHYADDGKVWDLNGTESITKGDRLWVREAWRTVGDAALSECTGPEWLTFRATDPEELVAQSDYRPSIHLPRWGSRITLHVTDVRVQRLQAISEADALAEGIEYDPSRFQPHCPFGVRLPGKDMPTVLVGSTAAGAYKLLWQEINGDASWHDNPWVVAITFTVERANIDAARP